MKKLIVAAVCLAAVLPSLAANKAHKPAKAPQSDNFTKGCAFYNSGHYNEALAYLQDTVSKKPNYWQGHYYLAHTYLNLGQRTEALAEYERTESCSPPSDVMTACQSVATRLAQSRSSQGYLEHATNSASHQAYIRAQKQAIIDRACDDNNRIRNATIDSITNGTYTAGGNSSQSGLASFADQERARQLRLETERKANETIEAAHKRMRELH